MKATFSRNLVVVVVCFLGAASANAANLVINGGFETPVGEQCFLAPGTLGGWTTSGNFEGSCYITSNFDNGRFPVAYSGNQMMYVNNANHVGTSISQSLSLLAGQHYDLSFAMSGIGFQRSTPSLNVSIAGQSMTFASPTGKSWVLEDWIFTPAATGLTTLTFSATSTAGVVIDAVSLAAVAAVPEPQTVSLMIGGLAVLGALLRRRSKQMGIRMESRAGRSF